MEETHQDPREYPRRPFVGVGVVVFRDQSVLLIRRGNPPRAGEWSLPGGAQHVGETVRETALREVLEETGVEIHEPQFLEVIDAIMRDDRGRTRYHYTLIDFWAEWRAGDPAAADDAQHAEWIPLSRLDSYSLWTKTIEVIRTANGARRTQQLPER
ncbi:MAG: NUDIX domain-containing protein [Spirochaetaceae bacterium]|nr:MAG: NUDIX domain-containing protein [Spirochaetaceae bacterium]